MEPNARDAEHETVLLRVERDPSRRSLTIRAEIADQLVHQLRPATFNHIIAKMADIWIEKNAQAILDLIAPESVADAIKTEVARRVLQVVKDAR